MDYQYQATTTTQADPVVTLIIFVLYFALLAVCITGSWKMYVKAGKPGWAVLIPFYNLIVLFQIINRPWWWLLFLFIPIVNIVVGIKLAIELARAFGKSTTFGVVALWLFAGIGYMILGFGKSVYTKPAHEVHS